MGWKEYNMPDVSNYANNGRVFQKFNIDIVFDIALLLSCCMNANLPWGNLYTLEGHVVKLCTMIPLDIVL